MGLVLFLGEEFLFWRFKGGMEGGVRGIGL